MVKVSWEDLAYANPQSWEIKMSKEGDNEKKLVNVGRKRIYKRNELQKQHMLTVTAHVIHLQRYDTKESSLKNEKRKD